MKKTLAILLSLALVICMIPGTAFADVVKTSIADATVTVATGTCTYNGSEQTPAVTVTMPAVEGQTEAVTLVKDTDYTVAYSDNKNAGTATVTVTGIGNYEGTKTETFTIEKAEASSLTITIDKQIADTSTIAPADVHYFFGGVDITTQMQNQFDITVKTANSVATVTAKNTNINFKNSKDVNYTTGYNISSYYDITLSSGNIEYTGSDLSSYARLTQKTGTTPPKYITSNDYSMTFNTNPVAAGTYTVTVEGRNDYAGKLTKQMVINPRDVAKAGSYISIASIPTQVQGKYDINPAVTDSLTGKALVKGTDYLIKTSDIHIVGNTGTVEFIFQGNYTGTKTASFTVVTSDYDVETMQVYFGSNNVTSTPLDLDAFMYNGSSQPLSGITVYKNATEYTKKNALSSYYYSISYEYDKDGKTIATSYPTDAKDYKVYVVGQGGYAGKKYIGTYNIPKYNMDYATVTVSTGTAAAKPVVTVRSYEGAYFTEGKDFTVYSFVSESTNKVYVSISSTLDGNLTGSKSEYYALVAKPITSCSVYFTNGKSTSAYTGSVISAPITVKDGYYTTLTQGTHYTVTYKNSLGKVVSSIRDAGTYTIEITGKGIYSGTTYLTYTVTGKDISHYTVTLKESSVQANGYSKVPTITSVKDGYYTTLSSSNYTVTYKNYLGETVTSMSAPGTYTVVVTGKNGYQGSTSATFRIVGLDQEVTITNGTSKKVYEDSDSFKLTAKATGDGTGFTWTTSDPTVATVSYNGTVTVVGVGRAKITATTTGNKKYNPEEASFIVKVYPDKVKQTKKPWTDGKKGQLKVRWGYQEGVTKYEIRYSTSKSFSTYSTKTVNAHGKDLATQSTTLKNLKSGKTYYIKVRAVYQTYNEEGTKITYRGSWSPWRSAKTK